ncbi:hypothetical protein TNCV_3104801 [Trichonephila clavipes]|nr:hypothetical protein TNCV_3104801 [Trichonephila clavipes]
MMEILRVRVFALPKNTRAISIDSRHFEPRSSDEDDTAGTPPSPNYSHHRIGKTLNLDRLNVHQPPLRCGSSVALGSNL